ncbi:MAG: hypothetical protein JXR65_02635 [Bacteroidales bacterium]|nr:hypothetical protein [Bacteroidales bacterium]
MKTTILLFTFLLISVFTYAQTYNELKVIQKNGNVYKLQNVTLDLSSNTLNYVDARGNKVSENLGVYSKLEKRDGSYWLEGLAGGVVGSVLYNITTVRDGQEWWYGIGRSIFIGAGAATIVGGLIPKYKEVKLGKNTKLEMTPIALRLRF